MARFIGTTTPLAGNAEWSDRLQAGREDYISGIVYSDVAGSLKIEQSVDGQNWDFDTAPVAVAAGVGSSFKEEVFAPYVKITYTNGAAAQTVLRLAARFTSAGNR